MAADIQSNDDLLKTTILAMVCTPLRTLGLWRPLDPSEQPSEQAFLLGGFRLERVDWSFEINRIRKQFGNELKVHELDIDRLHVIDVGAGFEG